MGEQRPAEIGRRDFVFGVVGAALGVTVLGGLGSEKAAYADTAPAPTPTVNPEREAAEIEQLRAQAEQTRANAEETRAKAAKTRAEAKQVDSKTTTDAAKEKADLEKSPWKEWIEPTNFTAVMKESGAQIVGVVGAVGTAYKVVHEVSKAKAAERQQAEKERKAQEAADHKALDDEFTGLYDMLRKGPAASEGAEAKLRKFTRPEHSQYHQDVFNLTRDLLHNRQIDPENPGLEPSPFYYEVIGSFLAVLPHLRTVEQQKQRFNRQRQLSMLAGEAAPIAFNAHIAPTLSATNIKLNGANLINTDLSDVNFSGASFESALLDYARFEKSDLSSANLKNVKARNAQFINTPILGATLSGIDLRSAFLQDINFDGITLGDGELVAGAQVEDAVNLSQDTKRALRRGKAIFIENGTTSTGDDRR